MEITTQEKLMYEVMKSIYDSAANEGVVVEQEWYCILIICVVVCICILHIHIIPLAMLYRIDIDKYV